MQGIHSIMFVRFADAYNFTNIIFYMFKSNKLHLSKKLKSFYEKAIQTDYDSSLFFIEAFSDLRVLFKRAVRCDLQLS